jgi:hypothetical protein
MEMHKSVAEHPFKGTQQFCLDHLIRMVQSVMKGG